MSAKTELFTRREALTAAAVLAVAQLTLMFRVLFLDAALHGRDVLHHYWPLYEAVRRALSEGRLPAWDIGVQGGMPLLANPHAAVFYPPNLLYQLLDFPRAYAWLVFAHTLVLGLGVWALLRRWAGQPAAVAGALTLTLCGPVASLNTYGPLLGSLCWTPWAVWAQLSPWRWNLRVAAVGALVALQVLGGDPMPALFTALLSAACLGLERRERSAAAVLVAGFALAGLSSAVQALPSLEALGETVRAGGAGRGAWSMHPARALEWALPDLFGHYLEPPMFWGNFLSNGPVLIPFLLSAYFGAGALALALAGARRDRLALLGASVFGTGALLALGTHFAFGPLLEHVPPFSFFRYPEKYLLFAAFGWSMLVAAGVEVVGQGALNRRAIALAMTAAVVGLAALLLTGPLSGVLEGWVQAAIGSLRLPVEGGVSSVREAAMNTLAFGLLTALVIAAGGRVRPGLAPWLLVALCGVDLWLAAQRTIWTGPISLYREAPELPQKLAQGAAQKPFRFWRDNARLERWVQGSGTYEGMAERRAFDAMSLKTGIGAVWGLEDLGNPSPVVLTRWRALTSAPGAEKARALALYNVCAVVASGQSPIVQSPMLRPLFALPFEAAAFALEGCVPRLSFARRVRAVASAEEAVRAVLDPGFVPGEDAVVEAVLAPLAVEARVLEAKYEPSGAAWARLEAPDGGLLVYAMSWFPGWRATIDGHPAQPMPVNGALVGVEIPKGASEVRFEFMPRRFGLGLFLTLLGCVGLLTLCVFRPLSGFVIRR